MKKLIIYSVLFILFSNFTVGSGTAFLTCKSDSGRTEFYAEIQDIESTLEKAILTIDETQLQYKTDEGHIIFDPENGVLTMYIDDFKSQSKYLQFWSIPSTFKIIKNKNHHQIYEFKAKIYGSEPRENKENHIPMITLNCKLEYQI
ncbi:MAG: hypothetical protein V3U80_01100 [Flavobacteriaceae bacterium]